MKTLHLNLHRKWFDMILSGEKKEEYRNVTDYWVNRITKTRLPFTTITFSNGYAKDRPQLVIAIESITTGQGKREWGAEKGKEYIIIKLGNIIVSNPEKP